MKTGTAKVAANEADTVRSSMPAEWGKHDASWLAWPHNTRDWPGRFAPIPWVYTEIVRNVALGEKVNLLVDDASCEARAKAVLRRAAVPLEQLVFRRFRTDRVWTRDSGPIFVFQGGKKVVAGFRFNGWAKYPNHRNDEKNPQRVARALGLNLVPVVERGRSVVLEGGSFDVNGRGSVLTTEECLLDPVKQVRNPGLQRADYEAVFARTLGARNVIWLGSGIAGDDTHGHVDDLARFVGSRTIVLAREKDPRDPNYRPLEENRERLRGARLEDGSRPEVVELPMPRPVFFDGQRLPASYANFYLCNAATLVPTFDDPNDRIALGILGESVPDRPVIGIHALDLVWGLGTLHCLSQQEPSPS